MTSPDKKKLIDKLRANHASVLSFCVTMTELCLQDHPPSSAKWSYSGEEREGREIFTSLKHDRTTMLTASFDLLSPVNSAAMQRLTEKSGKLRAYHTDCGKSVTRSYDLEVTYIEDEKTELPATSATVTDH
jgi:hypothetical protein